jgi:hypothetical protein
MAVYFESHFDSEHRKWRINAKRAASRIATEGCQPQRTKNTLALKRAQGPALVAKRHRAASNGAQPPPEACQGNACKRRAARNGRPASLSGTAREKFTYQHSRQRGCFATLGLGTERACPQDRPPPGGGVPRRPHQRKFVRRRAAGWRHLPTNRRAAPSPL